MRPVYFIWAILPLIFLFLVTQEYLRRVFKKHGKEDIGNYLKQFLYTVIALALAIVFDKYAFPSIADSVLPGRPQETTIISWLLYPLVIVVMLKFTTFKRKKEDGRGSKRRGTYVFRR